MGKGRGRGLASVPSPFYQDLSPWPRHPLWSYLAEMGVGEATAKSGQESWDTQTTPFPGAYSGVLRLAGAESAGWEAGCVHSICPHGPGEAGGVLVWGTATSLSISEEHDWRLRAVTASGALWSPNPKDNRAAEKKGKMGFGGRGSLTPSRAPRRSRPSIPQFSLPVS